MNKEELELAISLLECTAEDLRQDLKHALRRVCDAEDEYQDIESDYKSVNQELDELLEQLNSLEDDEE